LPEDTVTDVLDIVNAAVEEEAVVDGTTETLEANGVPEEVAEDLAVGIANILEDGVVT